ncbi:MAG TPA: hypothetical protein VFR55_00340 [Dehalococcoidia bacterium]|nr:hypothetical protein [Dehalococcoidia bacterium]
MNVDAAVIVSLGVVELSVDFSREFTGEDLPALGNLPRHRVGGSA